MGAFDSIREAARRRMGDTTRVARQSPVGGLSMDGLDEQALQDIGFIRRNADIELADYAQRRAANSAEAESKRSGVRRDMGINRNALQGALGRTNQSYADLVVNLGSLIPSTEQAYAQGAQGIGQAYAQGAQQLAAPDVAAQGLEAQLAALTGGQTDNLAAGLGQERASIADALRTGGAAAVQNLQTLGAGDVAAARAAIPGYTDERNERLNDVNLAANAEYSDLANALHGITPEFVPFNQAALQLQTEQAIADVIRQSQTRTGAQRDKDNSYAGRQDLQRFAHERNQDDLGRYLLDAYQQANEGQYDDTGEPIDPHQFMYQAILDYTADTPGGVRGAGRDVRITNPAYQDLYNEFAQYGGDQRTLDRVVSQAAEQRGIPQDILKHIGGSIDSGARRRQESQTTKDRQVLQDMLAILYGEYSSQ